MISSTRTFDSRAICSIDSQSPSRHWKVRDRDPSSPAAGCAAAGCAPAGAP
jgi:hypothetical protein